jgi:hypothetical protein
MKKLITVVIITFFAFIFRHSPQVFAENTPTTLNASTIQVTRPIDDRDSYTITNVGSLPLKGMKMYDSQDGGLTWTRWNIKEGSKSTSPPHLGRHPKKVIKEKIVDANFTWVVCDNCGAVESYPEAWTDYTQTPPYLIPDYPDYLRVKEGTTMTVTTDYPNGKKITKSRIGFEVFGTTVHGILTMDVGTTLGGNEVGSMDWTTEDLLTSRVAPTWQPAEHYWFGYDFNTSDSCPDHCFPNDVYYLTFHGTGEKLVELWNAHDETPPNDPVNFWYAYKYNPGYHKGFLVKVVYQYPDDKEQEVIFDFRRDK